MIVDAAAVLLVFAFCPESENRSRSMVLAKARDLWAFGSEPAVTVFSDDERGDWTPRLPSRLVSSLQSDPVLLLLPGRPASRLISPREGGSGWAVKADDLPVWATEAVYQNGTLLLVGALDGEIRAESRRLSAT